MHTQPDNTELTEAFVLEAVEMLDRPVQSEGVLAVESVIRTGSYNDILLDLVKSHVTESRAQELIALWRLYDNSLFEARKNNVEAAGRILAEAGSLQANHHFEPMSEALADVWALPIRSYLHYKEERYEVAERLLWQSIDNTNLLIKSGFYILEYYRLQQLHNLARLYLKQERVFDAAKIIRKALAYMLLEQTPALPGRWSVDSLRRAPNSLRSDMLMQLSVETIGVFLHYHEHDQALFSLAFGQLSHFEPRTADEKTMQQWFTLRELYFVNTQPTHFITGTIHFLRNAPNRFDNLKFGLVVNLMDLLDRLFCQGEVMQDKLFKFGSKLRVMRMKR